MEMIYPLHEEHISRFCGLPVCAVTHDGRRHIGVLSHCRNGMLTFNEFAGAPGAGSPVAGSDMTFIQNKIKKAKNGKKTKTVPQAKAQTQAFVPYGYGYGPYSPFGEAFALDLSLIAFLFLLFL